MLNFRVLVLSVDRFVKTVWLPINMFLTAHQASDRMQSCLEKAYSLHYLNSSLNSTCCVSFGFEYVSAHPTSPWSYSFGSYWDKNNGNFSSCCIEAERKLSDRTTESDRFAQVRFIAHSIDLVQIIPLWLLSPMCSWFESALWKCTFM